MRAVSPPGARALPRLGRPGSWVGSSLAAGWRALPRPARRWGAAALATLAAAAAGYFLWLRDSSLVRVEQVAVSGLTSRDSGRVRAALRAAAREMTTLHVRPHELRRAVRGFPAIRSLEATPDFPHRLRIRVVEHRPVAVLVAAGGQRVPVAPDGTVVAGLPLRGAVPEIGPGGGFTRRGRLADPAALRSVAVLAAAPAPIARLVAAAGVAPGRGLVMTMREGPDLIFGDASRRADKWRAAARVLADPGAAGASYVDLRLPDRPVAGGLAAAPAPASSPGGAGSDEASGAGDQGAGGAGPPEQPGASHNSQH